MLSCDHAAASNIVAEQADFYQVASALKSSYDTSTGWFDFEPLVTATDTIASTSTLTPGETYVFAVRGVSSEHGPGEYSDASLGVTVWDGAQP